MPEIPCLTLVERGSKPADFCPALFDRK